jgi:CHAT domain-containing protein
LSACETAKGVIDPVDGVYGLQQAFKKAGVGTIVMSLWKIPDEATSLLMNSFYAALISGNEKHNALKKAMQEAQLKYKDPYYWAGFIILD